MSFAANQARLTMLIAMQYDIELQTQFLLQHKLYLQKAVGEFMNLQTEHEPGSPGDRNLQARIAQLTEAEKVLEVRLEKLRQKERAIATEREGLTKHIEENAKKSFSAWGNGASS